MMWESIVTESASLILRWLHVVAGVAWIGSSFYIRCCSPPASTG